MASSWIRASSMLLVALLLLSGTAIADEGQTCSGDCPKVKELEAVNEQLRQDVAGWSSFADSIKAQADSVPGLQAEIESLQSQVAQLTSAATTSAQTISSLKAEAEQQAATVKALKDDLAKESAAKPAPAKEIEWSDVWKLVSKTAIQTTNSVVEESKLIIAGLKEGDTSRLAARATDGAQWAQASATSCHAFVLTNLEKHAPFVKEHAAKAYVKAGELYRTHVAESHVVAEVKRHLNTANEELKGLLSKQIKSHPQLAALDDPVAIQILAYAIIGAPLMLLSLPIMLWFATLFTPAAKAAPATKAGKGKKGKGKKH